MYQTFEKSGMILVNLVVCFDSKYLHFNFFIVIMYITWCWIHEWVSRGWILQSSAFWTSFLVSVFVSIQRRQLKHVKAAVPVILSALKIVSLELDDEDANPQDLYHTAVGVGVADSIKSICTKLVSDFFFKAWNTCTWNHSVIHHVLELTTPHAGIGRKR